MGSIGNWGAGATPSRGNSAYYKDGEILWLKTGGLNDGVIYDSEEKITQLALRECSLKLNKVGDVLIAMYGATIGKLGIVGQELTTNQACCGCTPYEGIYNYYLFYFLMANKTNFIKQGEGGAQPNISKDKLIRYLIPIPPYAEQLRIADRIEFVNPLLAQYDAASVKLASINRTLTGHLKKSILQYAIQGKLVSQNPEDEPANELLKCIEEEKARRVIRATMLQHTCENVATPMRHCLILRLQHTLNERFTIANISSPLGSIKLIADYLRVLFADFKHLE